MKKYTNKILVAFLIAFALLMMISITVDFQVKYHKNPEQFDPAYYTTYPDESDTVSLPVEDVEEVEQ